MMSETVKNLNAAMNAVEKMGVEELNYLIGVAVKKRDDLLKKEEEATGDGDDPEFTG